MIVTNFHKGVSNCLETKLAQHTFLRSKSTQFLSDKPQICGFHDSKRIHEGHDTVPQLTMPKLIDDQTRKKRRNPFFRISKEEKKITQLRSVNHDSCCYKSHRHLFFSVLDIFCVSATTSFARYTLFQLSLFSIFILFYFLFLGRRWRIHGTEWNSQHPGRPSEC